MYVDGTNDTLRNDANNGTMAIFYERTSTQVRSPAFWIQPVTKSYLYIKFV